MSRSGYSDDNDDQWGLIRWRGAVASAMRGRKGQAFLVEMLAALDALPERRLIAHELEAGDQVCAIGAVGKARGLSMKNIDIEDHERVAVEFGISHALACEVMFENDDVGPHNETPEQRFARMRRWIKRSIWNARGCVFDPYGKQSAPRMMSYPFWRTVIDWNEV